MALHPSDPNRDPALLELLHGIGDAPADQVITSLIGSGGIPQANAALSHMIRNMDGPDSY